MPSNKLFGVMIQTAAGNAIAAAMDPPKHIASPANARMKTTSAMHNAPAARAQDKPRRRRDAFAAFELQPAGVIVAEHGENAGQPHKSGLQFNRLSLKTASKSGKMRGKPVENQRGQKCTGGITFQTHPAAARRSPPVSRARAWHWSRRCCRCRRCGCQCPSPSPTRKPDGIEPSRYAAERDQDVTQKLARRQV